MLSDDYLENGNTVNLGFELMESRGIDTSRNGLRSVALCPEKRAAAAIRPLCLAKRDSGQSLPFAGLDESIRVASDAEEAVPARHSLLQLQEADACQEATCNTALSSARPTRPAGRPQRGQPANALQPPDRKSVV